MKEASAAELKRAYDLPCIDTRHEWLVSMEGPAAVLPCCTRRPFYGRNVELKLIDDHLRAQKLQDDCKYPIIAIHGLGGIG